jgi:hypothetical protein
VDAGLCFAVIALLVQVLVPPGFMAATTASGPALVICTGQGPLTATGDARGHPLKPLKSAGDQTCVFAGRSGPAPPIALHVPPVLAVAYLAPADRSGSDLMPGRGLAAPPPPSQGPPQTAI